MPRIYDSPSLSQKRPVSTLTCRWRCVVKRLLKIVGFVLVGLIVVALGAVAYAAATTDGRLRFPETPRPEITASQDPAVIERGRYLVHGPAHCEQCHSNDERAHPEKTGTTPLHGGLSFVMGPLGTRYARNLTSHATTGLGRYTDAEIARVLRTGVLHDGEVSFFMRFAASDLATDDIVAVLSYLRSLAPVEREVPPGRWTVVGKVLLTYAFAPLEPRRTPAPTSVPASDVPSVARGEYLVERVMLCTSCHTATNPTTFEVVGPKAGGSLPEASHGDDSDMEFVAPNLTSHPTGWTGRTTEDAFVARLKAGRVHRSSIMPWESFGRTSEADLRSVYAYLRSLPPADRDVGLTYRKIGAGDQR